MCPIHLPLPHRWQRGLGLLEMPLTDRQKDAEGKGNVGVHRKAAESYFMCTKVVFFLLQYKCLCLKYKTQASKSHRRAS